MTHIVPIQIDENTVVWLESNQDVIVQSKVENLVEEAETNDRTPKGLIPNIPKPPTPTNFASVENTIRSYTNYALNAFRHAAIADVEEVTLQFGIEISGEAGLPYITKGTAKSNLNITVKCKFPKPVETQSN